MQGSRALLLALVWAQLEVAAFGQIQSPNGTSGPRLPKGVRFNQTELADRIAENGVLYENYTRNSSWKNGGCGGDWTHMMPVCYQICDEWCWATMVTMTGDYYKGQDYCEGFECAVVAKVTGNNCCPWTNSCHNTPNDAGSSCNRGGYPPEIRDAASYFTSGQFTVMGPLPQSYLDQVLNSGRVIIMIVHWQDGGGHTLMLGGCGNGYYYLHDPWGWYADKGEKQPPDWQGLTYDQVLRYPSPGGVGMWTNSIFWSMNDEEKHATALKQTRTRRQAVSV